MKSRKSVIFATLTILGSASLIGHYFSKKPLVSEIQAQTQTMNTGRAAYHVETEDYEHESGIDVLYLSFDGVQFTDAAEKPLDRAHQVCHATCRVATLTAQCMGYCSAVDDDGDMAWVTWERLDETGGTWEFLGGTGKYDGEDGGGTWTVGGQHGPHLVSNFWARNY